MEFEANRRMVVSVFLAVLLVSVCFIGLYKFTAGEVQPYVAAKPSFIDVLIDGPKKLGVNENGTYTAHVESETSGNLDFTWSVSPQDNKTVLSFDGAVAEFKFVIATEEPYLLSVQVEDVTRKNFGSAAYTVYDPFTSSNLYLTGSDAVFSYMVESDNLGWYRVKSGDTGAVVGSPGTNLATVTSGILASMTSGILFLKEVSFDLALLESIPEDVQVVESVNSRTRIFINSADSLGSPYTVSVEGSNYFAQDSANRYWATSTNGSYVINTALESLTSGRTWKETVVLSGKFGLSSGILQPSYSTIDATAASVYATGSISEALLQNVDNDNLDGGNTELEIIGGFWDSANFTRSDGETLHYEYVTNFRIAGANITGAYEDGLDIGHCSDGVVSQCFAYGNGKSGFHPSTDTVRVTFVQCTSSNNGYGVAGSNDLQPGGYVLVSSNRYINFIGCKSINDYHGIRLEGVSDIEWQGDVITPFRYAIYCPDDVAHVCGGAKLSGSFIAKNPATNDFIVIPRTVDIHFIDAKIYNTGATNKAVTGLGSQSEFDGGEIVNQGGRAIELGASKTAVSIRGVYFDTASNYAVDLASATNCLVESNIFVYSVADAMAVRNGGAGSIIRNNVGCVTENTVSVSNATATTFVITTTLDGNVTFASLDFDATTLAVSDFKCLGWVQTSASTITVTVSGTGLPVSMTCRAYMVYKP